MAEPVPVTELSAFSSPNATPTEWSQAHDELAGAEVYWLSTVRRDGRPHVTPLLGVWLERALYFCTGSNERKAKNLSANPHCVLTTGHNTLDGLDLVIQGTGEGVSDHGELERVASTYESKYGPHFVAPDGTWSGLGDAIRRTEGLVLSRRTRDRLWVWQRRQVQPDALELLTSTCPVRRDGATLRHEWSRGCQAKSIDAVSVHAKWGAELTGPNPTDRGKPGSAVRLARLAARPRSGVGLHGWLHQVGPASVALGPLFITTRAGPSVMERAPSQTKPSSLAALSADSSVSMLSVVTGITLNVSVMLAMLYCPFLSDLGSNRFPTRSIADTADRLRIPGLLLDQYIFDRERLTA